MAVRGGATSRGRVRRVVGGALYARVCAGRLAGGAVRAWRLYVAPYVRGGWRVAVYGPGCGGRLHPGPGSFRQVRGRTKRPPPGVNRTRGPVCQVRRSQGGRSEAFPAGAP